MFLIAVVGIHAGEGAGDVQNSPPFPGVRCGMSADPEQEAARVKHSTQTPLSLRLAVLALELSGFVSMPHLHCHSKGCIPGGCVCSAVTVNVHGDTLICKRAAFGDTTL